MACDAEKRVATRRGGRAPQVRNLSDTGLCLSRVGRKAVACVAQVLLFVGRASKDIPAGIYISERGGDGRGVVRVLGDAPNARAGFEIVIVALLLLSFAALLRRRRLRRGHKFRDDATRTRP